MFTIGEYFFYNDPVKIIWRKGTPDDPYRDIIDNLVVVDNRTVLSEIPDEFHRVQIEGYTELIQDKWDSPRRPQESEFIVNYQNGVITFHETKNAEVVTAEYKGRGIIQYPAERIYIHTPNPYTIDNLQHFIEFLTQAKIEIDEALLDVYEATQYANNAANFANEQGNYAQQQGDIVNNLITNANVILDNCEEATEDAIEATGLALDAKNQAIYAKNTSIMIWKEPVENYGEINAQYPYPEIGWTTMVLDSGRRYRFNGAAWDEIDNFTAGALPTASEDVDGLMSKESYIKLEDISEELNENFVNILKIRTLVFVFPGDLLHGTQTVVLQFPFKGILQTVKAFIKQEGATDTKIQINKISENDFNNFGYFLPILNEPLLIPQYERSGISNDFTNIVVNINDYFNITLLEEAVNAKDLTVQVNILLN